MSNNGIPLEFLEACRKVVPKPFRYNFRRCSDIDAVEIQIHLPIFSLREIPAEHFKNTDAIEFEAKRAIEMLKEYCKRLVANDFDFIKTDAEMSEDL